MSLKIVLGGTTGAADGTLVSSGNPIVFTGLAIDTPIDAHIRADDDTYGQSCVFEMDTTAGPAVGKGDLQVSIDGGSTWHGWADNPFSLDTGVGIGGTDIGDLNFPIKLRQHAASPPGDTSGGFDTDGTLAAATALGDVTGFTVTPGDTQMALAWSAVTNRTAYRIDRATDSGFTTGVALDISPGQTSTSFTDTGRTNGTTYYYRIKAVGTYRYKDSASYATGNGLFAPVAGFAVTSVSGTTVNLGWTAFSGANHYKIERGTDGVTFGTTVSDAATGTSYADTGLTVNTVYYYRITAHDASHNALSSTTTSTVRAGVQILLAAPSHDITIRSANASFATARAGVSSTLTLDSGDHPTEGSAGADLDSGAYHIDRHLMHFDGSSLIPSGVTVDQAWLRLTTTYQHAGTNAGLAIVKHAAASAPATTADFQTCVLTDLGGPSSALAVNTPTDYAITSPASNIVVAGITKLAIIERGKDYGNTAPPSATTYGNNIGGGTNATTDRRPQLKVSFHS